MFVVSHLVLGVGVLWSVIIQESGVLSVMNAVTIISFVLVSLLNFWIWMCPMDRIRNVSCKIDMENLKSKTTLCLISSSVYFGSHQPQLFCTLRSSASIV